MQGKRVLIVDDNATNRQILARQTRVVGPGRPRHRLPARGDRAGSRAAIRSTQPCSTCTCRRSTASRSHASAARAPSGLPLILLTSLGRREEAASRPLRGALTKPIKPSQLYDALLDALGEAATAPAAVREEEDAPAVAIASGLRILLARTTP